MPSLELLPLGVGDAFSTVHYSSSYALRAEGRWLLVDCPHPIRKMMREASAPSGVALDVDALEAVVLTHLHADHVSGVEDLGFFSYFALGRRARLAAHPDVARRLWDGHLAAGMERLAASDGSLEARTFDDYFELTPLDEARPVRIGPFQLECRFTCHHVPTTALRIRAGGRAVGFSADTSFDPDLIDWLGAADLVVHEAGFGIHTPLERLGTVPAETRTRMRLGHFSDALDLSESPVEPLQEGRLYVV
ncbi:MBL fold metallo-hydrolase [Anaeromyxobacter terrae]|uniref:MBL fold metallo-hydrolase n=1 Tax=Anaeromyxobacter terrae TaxID=2925406 RepID=UPI001F56D1C1|nr:MBL fold metallo-hydrolase [Anaeromyxobacter sp. SG22]